MYENITGIFLTYEMKSGVSRNVARYLQAFPKGTAVVVDNSSNRYKKQHNLRDELSKQSGQIIYVDHQRNNRLGGYCKGIAYCLSGHVVFRTDDDIFDEACLKAQMDSADWPDFAVTPHFYEGKLQRPSSWQRPLESVIIKADLLQRLCPLKQKPGGDWDLLKRAMTQYSYQALPEPVLSKCKHGRKAA